MPIIFESFGITDDNVCNSLIEYFSTLPKQDVPRFMYGFKPFRATVAINPSDKPIEADYLLESFGFSDLNIYSYTALLQCVILLINEDNADTFRIADIGFTLAGRRKQHLEICRPIDTSSEGRQYVAKLVSGNQIFSIDVLNATLLKGWKEGFRFDARITIFIDEGVCFKTLEDLIKISSMNSIPINVFDPQKETPKLLKNLIIPSVMVDNGNDSYSIFTGKIITHKRSRTKFGSVTAEFYVITLKTGIGTVDCVASCETFPEESLTAGSYIFATGCISCDCAVNGLQYYRTASIM